MIFPLWVLTVSIFILAVSLRGKDTAAEGALGVVQTTKRHDSQHG